MTNISKRPLKHEDFQKLSKQFTRTLSHLTSKTSDGFIHDLLGEEERIMLVKRLAAIVLFAEGHSSYRVWKTLDLSPSTAQTIREKFEHGEYEHIRKMFTARKQDYRAFLEIIEIVARGGLPPVVGPGRWRGLSSVRGTMPKHERT